MTPIQRTLLAGAIDYAGLFPPARLDMASAVANYRRYRAGADRWALGRFVCPVGRLQEFAVARGSGGDCWSLAAVAGGDPHEEATAIVRFNQDYFGRARVEALEAKTADADTVQQRVQASLGLPCFCELNPSSPEFLTTAAAVRAAGAYAKLRTGGLVPDAIPSAPQVLHFLQTCHGLHLAFKATAGLHHPFRGIYPLTYETDAPQAVMHGFVNLSLAAAAIAGAAPPDKALAILESQDPASLTPDLWPMETLSAARHFFVSFGSCAFEEPLQWLQLPG